MFAKRQGSLVAVALVSGMLCGTAIANEISAATASPTEGVTSSARTPKRCPPQCYPAVPQLDLAKQLGADTAVTRRVPEFRRPMDAYWNAPAN